jgi:hypothetical protein
MGNGRWAEDLLRTMQTLMKKSGFRHVQPDRESYNYVISAWGKSNNHNAGSHVDRLLAEMELESSMGMPHLQPDAATYTNVIFARAKFGDSNGAEAIWMKMCQEFNAENSSLVEPTTWTCNAVLEAWAHSEAKDAGRRAEVVLRNMYHLYDAGFHNIQPDVESYNWVMFAWTKSKHSDAGKMSERLLVDMIRKLKEPKYSHLKPDAKSYGLVILAQAKCGNIKRAKEILGEICANYQKGNTDVVPDIRSFNAIIDALRQSKATNAGEKAEKILQDMYSLSQSGLPHIQPNLVTYNSVIHVWARSRHAESGKKAELLLEDMQHHGVQPDIKTYTSLMNAWALQGDVDRVETILNQLCDDYIESVSGSGKEKNTPTTPVVEPDAFCFSILLGALAQSKRSDVAERAYAVLERMDQLYEQGMRRAKPTVVTFRMALRCLQGSSNGNPLTEERIATVQARIGKLSSKS